MDEIPDDEIDASPEELAKAERRFEEVSAALRLATEDLGTLRSLPFREWSATIDGTPERFCSRMLAELLLEDSLQLMDSEPVRAEAFASVVPVVLNRIPVSQAETWAADLLDRAEALRRLAEDRRRTPPS